MANEEAKELARPIIRKRWPDGKPKCIYCGINTSQVFLAKKSLINSDPQLITHWCNICNREYTNKTGTIMHHSKVPIEKWEKALEIIEKDPKKNGTAIAKEVGIDLHTAMKVRTKILLAKAMHKGGETVDNGPFRGLYSGTDREKFKAYGREKRKQYMRNLRARRKAEQLAESAKTPET